MKMRRSKQFNLESIKERFQKTDFESLASKTKKSDNN